MAYLPDGKYLVVPDLQIPYHDPRFVDRIVYEACFADGVLCVGDESDSPEPSRWNKGTAGEYTGTLEAGLVATHKTMARLVDALGPHRGAFHVMRSNHQERVDKYISRYAPALADLAPLGWEALMGYGQPSSLTGKTLDITFHRRPFEFARGWVLAHGDEGSLIQTAGGTAMGLAKRWGKSVVCGHTHRAGLQHNHLMVNGKVGVELFGIEVGHGMDIKKAGYLRAGYGNWQKAYAWMEIVNGKVQPNLVIVR